MAHINKLPWEVGSILMCSKCGAKFNEPNLAEEAKSQIRKYQKDQQTATQIRVIVTGCLGVCFPEKQTFAYMPVNGQTEVYTTELNKETLVREVKELISKKVP